MKIRKSSAHAGVETCRNCNGRGKTHFGLRQCPVCRGIGTLAINAVPIRETWTFQHDWMSASADVRVVDDEK